MDVSDHHRRNGDAKDEDGRDSAGPPPRQLPRDLPKSLYDRKVVRSYGGETEMYDAWQGME